MVRDEKNGTKSDLKKEYFIPLIHSYFRLARIIKQDQIFKWLFPIFVLATLTWSLNQNYDIVFTMSAVHSRQMSRQIQLKCHNSNSCEWLTTTPMYI